MKGGKEAGLGWLGSAAVGCGFDLLRTAGRRITTGGRLYFNEEEQEGGIANLNFEGGWGNNNGGA